MEQTSPSIQSTQISFAKFEFWAVTTIFAFVTFYLVTDGVATKIDTGSPWNKTFFDQANLVFSYEKHYLIPKQVQNTFLYLSFLLLNFVIVPKIAARENVVRYLLVAAGVFFLGWLVIGTTDTYIRNFLFYRYENESETYDVIFQGSFMYTIWLSIFFLFYTGAKIGLKHLLGVNDFIEWKYQKLTKDALTALAIWIVTVFLLIASDADGEVVFIWSVVAPFAIGLYVLDILFFGPQSLKAKRPFVSFGIRNSILVIILYFPTAIIAMLLTDDENLGFNIALVNSFLQLFIVVPINWLLFRRQLETNEELAGLKKELGQSHANIDFLRSQINPHFLFNALNTIYGTALQEKAERTSEAVEKLGSMMRFMLHENMQTKISLMREIEYLHNFMALQRLRTDPVSSIKIKTEIQDPERPVEIAPMLLIPFVENAFKHGISFREESYITVYLELKAGTLYFDVHNSRHTVIGEDPERGKSGVGLMNVRNRLQLIYPGKHQLVIRETSKDFFVHLTIDL